MRPTRINIFLALFFSASAFATTIPTDSTNNGNDSIQHSISGFESYFEKDVIQQSLLERLSFRSINRLVLLQPGSFYVGNDTYSSFGLLYGENANESKMMACSML